MCHSVDEIGIVLFLKDFSFVVSASVFMMMLVVNHKPLGKCQEA